jgi:pyruvate-formate lyase-activating enzyme
MMELKSLIDEIEEIKARLLMLEVKLIEKEDVEAIAEALKEFLEGKTFTFDPFNPDKHFL